LINDVEKNQHASIDSRTFPALEFLALACQESPVSVAIGAVPGFELVLVHADDSDDIDGLPGKNDAFQRLSEESRCEEDEGRVSALAEIDCRLIGPD
jgi:hypothetical protein